MWSRGKVNVVQIPAEINVSDMLTKVQSGTKVKRYIDLIDPIKIRRKRAVIANAPGGLAHAGSLHSATHKSRSFLGWVAAA